MSLPLPEATDPRSSRTDVFLGYLDYFRDQLLTKVEALGDDEAWGSGLPSGWTPLELVNHLTFVERRWLEWGFEGQALPDPWGDRRDGRWFVAADRTRAELSAALRAQGQRSAAVIESHELDEVGQPSPRWNGAEPATLERVLFHLMQEYARHLGHLDIVVELTGAPTGE